jgi:hypothetical protein
VKQHIICQLERRGYPPMRFDKLDNQICSTLGEKEDVVTKRARLEKILRRVAFEQRNLFPELQSSIVVHVWERTTGQTW